MLVFFNQLLYSHAKREGVSQQDILFVSQIFQQMEDVSPPIRYVVQDDIIGFS